jgi:Tol biopolymer transport system component
MHDDVTFETRLATALGRYAELAPDMDDLDVAERAIAVGRPSGFLGRVAELRRELTSTLANPATARFAYLLVILALLLAAVLVAVAVGVFRDDAVRPLGANGAIVYTVQGDNHGPVVTYVSNPDGTGLDEVASDTCPVYSSNGTRLVALSYDTPISVVATTLDGTDSRTLTLMNEAYQPVAFALSPDGSSVAWLKQLPSGTAVDRPGTELWVGSIDDGTSARILAQPAMTGTFYDAPLWSPDGRQIAVVSYVTDATTGTTRRTAISVVARDGSELRVLTTRASAYEGGMSWSPDGRFLTYVGLPDGSSSAGPSAADEMAPGDIFVVAADGSGDRAVVTSPEFESVPAWSPDGTFIAFETHPLDGPYRVATVGIDAAVTTGPPIVGPESEWFVWSPDGRQLLWQEITPLSAETFRTSIKTVDPEFVGPSTTVQDVDGLIRCTPSWQRIVP